MKKWLRQFKTTIVHCAISSQILLIVSACGLVQSEQKKPITNNFCISFIEKMSWYIEDDQYTIDQMERFNTIWSCQCAGDCGDPEAE